MKFLVIVFAAMALVSSTFACTCLHYRGDELYQKQLCEWNPDFVGIVEIRDNKLIEGVRMFTVKLIDVWKGPTNITKVLTPSESAACGQNASKYQNLIITAKIDDGLLNVDLCTSLWQPSNSDLNATLKNKLNNCLNNWSEKAYKEIIRQKYWLMKFITLLK